MIEILSEPGFTRREWLKLGVYGAAGMAAAQAGVQVPAARPPAKSVIQIWMWGGPAHLDTFDPKPDAGRDYCGPFDKPLATNVDGIRIGEMLPLLAKQADKYSIIRSMTHGNNGHETAAYIVQTGRQPDRLSWPGLGAIVSKFKGYDHGYTGLIPPYVVLTTTQGRFSECGFLGPKYKPFATGGDPAQPRFAVEGVVAPGISDERQKRRRDLLHRIDTLGRAMPTELHFHDLDRCEEQAYELILGDSRAIFDLSLEKDELRDRYGRNTFGQSCLMARRLVEQGVPYITINYKGWDTHKQHFETMRRRLPELDAGFATLIADLAERGLLESTVVWWGGEFGRTPKVLWEPPWNGGRNHFGNCFCSVLAGGGFRGGEIVGSSDATGSNVLDRPVHPNDLLGSICQRMGIDPEGPLPNPLGQDLKVMPAILPGFADGKGRLREIM
jgi:hypothetical protein